jgi:hypothetical protein
MVKPPRSRKLWNKPGSVICLSCSNYLAQASESSGFRSEIDILLPMGKASFMTASKRDQAVPVPFFKPSIFDQTSQ